MRSAAVIILTLSLSSGCATGYATLAGGGAVATIAAIAAAASGQLNPGLAAGEGFVLGALAGAIGGAVAGAVVRGKERRANEDLRTQMHLQRQRDDQILEERLRQLEAGRFSSAKSDPVDDGPRQAPPVRSGSHGLSSHVREFSADD